MGERSEITVICQDLMIGHRGLNITKIYAVLCYLQGTFRVYPLPQDPSEPLPPPMITNLPPSSPEECLVRVYVVSALELQPNDPTGLVSICINCF